jgi:predicted DNA-binding transcriptional regulator YafY
VLRLLGLLQARRQWPGPELAARLGVSVRTLRRDIDQLRDLGYPVDAARGVDGGYQLAPGAVLPPLLLDDDEAVAIAVGMRAAAQGVVPGVEEPAVRALAKLVQVLPPRLRRRVEDLRAATGDAAWTPAAASAVPAVLPDVLIALASACRDSEQLEFDYTARTGSDSHRSVEPHWLVPLLRRWYLVAYDLTRQDWRCFRLDRMAAPQATGRRFRPRSLPGGDPAAFVRAAMAEIPQPYRVEVLVKTPAEQARQRVGRWLRVEEVDPATCRLVANTDNVDWPAFALGLLDADFEVLSPAELQDRVRAWGTRFTRAASRVPRPTG